MRDSVQQSQSRGISLFHIAYIEITEALQVTLLRDYNALQTHYIKCSIIFFMPNLIVFFFFFHHANISNIILILWN